MPLIDTVRAKIERVESNTRVAITKKWPFLLLPVLESRRAARAILLTLNRAYALKMRTLLDTRRLFHITEHSSPLYRKYNDRTLDLGKIHNIALALPLLDGLVIQPGQVFSFWKHVGRTNVGRGYQKGLVLSDGKLGEDYGGGLCQLSNLLAYMFACTECAFMERRHHSRDVFPDSGRSVPFASGATVFFNLIDLKVKNTYNFPIVLSLKMTDTQLRGSISSYEPSTSVIKIEERDAGFYKSRFSGLTYRYNKIFRVWYAKGTKKKLKEEFLWENLARVAYNNSLITIPIQTI